MDKNDILNFDDTQVEPVRVPMWGGTVFVRVLPGIVRDRFEASLLDKRTGAATNLVNARARFACLLLCDKDGKPEFNEGEAGALGQKSGAALEIICEAGRRLNGMTEEAFDELVKNSQATVVADSTSDSPSPSDAPSANFSAE